MRILHVSKYQAMGGVETLVRDLSAEQARQGHAVTVLCHRMAPLGPTAFGREGGVDIVRCPVLFRTALLPVAPLFGRCLRRTIARFRPDVIHLHMPNPAALFLSALPPDAPLVVHWHADVEGSSSPLVRALHPLYRPFERRTLARAARIVATSPPYLDSSPTLAPWRDRCVVVPPGLDPERYPEDRAAAAAVPPLVLAAGRFVFYKGFEFLVRAAGMVPEATFVLAGDGPVRARVAGEVDRLGLRNRVELPGRVSDAELRALMQRASLFCLPSVDRGEALGITLVEAMRYGLPLVSTAIPGSGTAWVNQDRETGRVVVPSDPQALAGAIREILGDPAAAARYGAAGRTRFTDVFLAAGAARAMERVYEAAGAG